MALAIILILLVFWIGIVWSLFSSLNPFINKLGNTVNYNTAYYGAAMSAERWLLALRYHDAWFEWESGLQTGNVSDKISSTNFWRIAQKNSNAYWKITSRVKQIPEPWKWNVEALYAADNKSLYTFNDSKDYNTLWYNETIFLPLYLDETTNTGAYYTKNTSIAPISPDLGVNIIWAFRLPPKVQKQFLKKDNVTNYASSLLDDGSIASYSNIDTADIDDDDIWDDIIVQWGLQWKVNSTPFFIYPTVKNDFTINKPEYSLDNSLRESIINIASDENVTAELFNTNAWFGEWFSFFSDVEGRWVEIRKHNVLPLNSEIAGTSFSEIIRDKDGAIEWLMLSFAITNLMKTANNQIYPFLERQLYATDATNNITMPDRFFTLDAVGTVQDYTVRFLIKKPVMENSNVSNFTIIF